MSGPSATQYPHHTPLFLGIIFTVSCAHFINDIMQSMLPAIYPLLHQ